MFASAQSAAATLTVRHLVRAGAPVAGSMMWCMLSPRWLQRRTAVLEVARPPELIEIAATTVTMQPGDIFLTGSPPGVGPIQPGDEVVVEMDRVGKLALPVKARDW